MNSAVFDAAGERIASVSSAGVLDIWSVYASFKLPRIPAPPQQGSRGVASIEFSPEEAQLAVGRWNGSIDVFAMSTLEQDHSLQSPESDSKESGVTLSFGPDNLLASALGSSRTVQLWDTNSGRLRRELELPCKHAETIDSPPNVANLVLNPHGPVIAVSASDGCLVQWNTDTGKLTDHVEGHPEAIRSLAFSAASPYLASGSRDGEVRIWDRNRLKTGPELILQAETPQNLRWLVFSADGRWLAGGGEAHSIPWWDLQSRTQLSDVKTGSEQLRRVFFTANGRRMLVTGGGKLSICNLDQPGRGETLLTLTERDLPLEDVAVNRDGTLIAGVDKDGTVTLLDIRLDRLLALWRAEAARDEAPSPPNDG